MQDLLKAMNEYWSKHDAPIKEGRYNFFKQDDEESSNLESLFFQKLFRNGGHWSYDTKKFLEENGYRCWVGDGDSFGILVACITKDNKTFSVG